MMGTRPRIVAALFVLVAVVVGLHVLGAWADLALSDWPVWTDQPVDAITGGLRLVAIALSYYLIVVLVALFLVGDRLIGHRFEKLVPYGMLATFGLVAGVGMLSAATAPDPLAQVDSTEAAPLILRESATPLTLEAEDATGSAPGFTYAPHGQATAVDGWNVESGQTFWSIARETLQDAWGVDEVSDEEIVSYWKPLISANEDRLVDPGNADLILPGQQLVLPEPPASPAG